MGWEERGKRSYYYVKQWRDGRCHSEYCGHGDIGGLFAHTSVVKRHERTMARLARQDIQAEQRRIDQAIESYRAQVREVVAEALRALGFHQHKRQWRKVRKMVNEVAEQKTRTPNEDFVALMRAAGKKPAKSAEVEKFRKYAEQNADVFDHFALLAWSTLSTVMDMTEMTEATRICISGEVDALRRSLGKATASPLERLLIDDVAICWLRLQFAEQNHSNQMAKGVSLANGYYLDRVLSGTRRRYLQSIESLARVRGLLARVGVQINVAHQQVVQNG